MQNIDLLAQYSDFRWTKQNLKWPNNAFSGLKQFATFCTSAKPSELCSLLLLKTLPTPDSGVLTLTFSYKWKLSYVTRRNLRGDLGLAEQTLGSAKHLLSRVQVLVEEGLQRTSASQALGHSKFENKRYYWCAWNIISFERENSGKKERKGWDIHGLSQNPTLASFLTSLMPNVWLGSLEGKTWRIYYMIVVIEC